MELENSYYGRLDIESKDRKIGKMMINDLVHEIIAKHKKEFEQEREDFLSDLKIKVTSDIKKIAKEVEFLRFELSKLAIFKAHKEKEYAKTRNAKKKESEDIKND